MKLKCRINGNDYDIVQGATFTDNFNETLDSGLICLDQVTKIPDLEPYDDIYIWNADEEFNGYSHNSPLFYDVPTRTTEGEDESGHSFGNMIIDKSIDDIPFSTITTQFIEITNEGEYVDFYFISEKTENRIVLTPNDKKYRTWIFHKIENGDYESETFDAYSNYFEITRCEFTGNIPLPSFYKHFLVESYNEEMLGLETGLFKYTINLFSEIKKLEKIILPNLSITQSLVQEEKRSCWFYLSQYIELYSPTYKIIDSSENQTWKYEKKYVLSEKGEKKGPIVYNLKEIFDNVLCPEMSFTNPSLKDVLAQIMIVKDLIPIVKDDVICALDIGNITGNFDRKGNREIENDVTNFTYGVMKSADFCTDARREYSGALSQEKSAHLIEYLGFRNPNSPFLDLDGLTLETRFPLYKINNIKMCYYKKARLFYKEENAIKYDEIIFLCKQNITPLIIQNVVRNSLSTNWEKIPTYPNSLEEIAQYKLCTIGYDIGSNKLTGWGTKYEYLDYLWFKEEKTYLENLVDLCNKINPLGEYSVLEIIKGNPKYYDATGREDDSVRGIISFDGTTDNIAKQLKSIVFEIDYDAMYNGAIVHSKDNASKDDIVTADNCSSALTVLESDGLFESEKLDRLGNKIYTMTARYDMDNGGADIDRVQELGSYDEITDATIYMREYQIYDNAILANYEAMHEYVLKNYFTSVWAKYRTYSLMSYGESVRRAENVRQLLLLSKNSKYYELQNSNKLSIENFDYFFSFLSPTIIDLNGGRVYDDDTINCGFLTYNNHIYLSDVNSFTSGTSICFNISSYDNVSGGNYIDSVSSSIEFTPEQEEKAENDKVDLIDKYKTTQQWWKMPLSSSDAFMKNFDFKVCHLDKNAYFNSYIFDNDNINNVINYSPRYMALPKIIDNEDIESGKIDVSGRSLLLDDKQDFISNINNIIGIENYNICKDNKETLDITMQFDYMTNNTNDIFFSSWMCKLNDLFNSYVKLEEEKEIQLVSPASKSSNVMLYLYDYNTTIVGDRDGEHVVIKMKKSDFDNMNVNDEIYDAEFKKAFSSEYNYTQSSPYNYIVKKEDTTGTLKINKVTEIDKSDRKIKIDFTFSGRVEVTQEEIWFFVIVVNRKREPRLISYKGEIELSFVTSVIENNEEYYYLLGKIDKSVFEYPIGFGTNRASYLKTYKEGNTNVLQLNENNSVELTNSYITNDLLLKTKVMRQNMFIVVSTNKISKNLQHNFYHFLSDSELQDEEESINDFPNNTLVVSKLKVSEVFSKSKNETGLIVVNSNLVEEFKESLGGDIKSIQYYYRDNNTNTMYFVFGVNIDNYEPFNIYLSALSKRSLDVYDASHNIIGKMANALNFPQFNDNKQHYIVEGTPEYQSLNYLELNGKQYIDLTHTPRNTYVYGIDANCLPHSDSSDNGYIFVSHNGTPTQTKDVSDLNILARTQSINNELKPIVRYIGEYYPKLDTPIPSLHPIVKRTTSPIIELKELNNNIQATLPLFRVNNETIQLTVESGFVWNKNMRNIGLFGPKGSRFKGVFYNCKIYIHDLDATEEIKNIRVGYDLYPFERTNDGVKGLYDKVHNIFYPLLTEEGEQ